MKDFSQPSIMFRNRVKNMKLASIGFSCANFNREIKWHSLCVCVCTFLQFTKQKSILKNWYLENNMSSRATHMTVSKATREWFVESTDIISNYNLLFK